MWPASGEAGWRAYRFLIRLSRGGLHDREGVLWIHGYAGGSTLSTNEQIYVQGAGSTRGRFQSELTSSVCSVRSVGQLFSRTTAVAYTVTSVRAHWMA